MKKKKIKSKNTKIKKYIYFYSLVCKYNRGTTAYMKKSLLIITSTLNGKLI